MVVVAVDGPSPVPGDRNMRRRHRPSPPPPSRRNALPFERLLGQECAFVFALASNEWREVYRRRAGGSFEQMDSLRETCAHSAVSQHCFHLTTAKPQRRTRSMCWTRIVRSA